MRHRKAGVKLNRTTSHRKAMFRNMVTSLFKYDQIKTTDVKAKELRKWADHLITLAKRGDLHARRQALSIMREKDVVHKLFEEAGERFGNINGGYTRIIKLGRRPGDAAPISLIELVSFEKDKKKKKKVKTEKAQPVVPESKVAVEEAPEVVETAKADQAEDQTSDPVVAADEETAVEEKADASQSDQTEEEKPE